MSVPENKRKTGKLKVLTKADELAIYTINICSNEKSFPKRYRWCITNRIVDSVLELNHNIIKANSIYVRDVNDYMLRKEFQNKAIAESYSILSMIDIAYRIFDIKSDRITYWTSMVTEIQTLLRNWKKSDKDSFENKKKLKYKFE